jgi:hypothetical protein
VPRRRTPTSQAAKKLGERERVLGLETEDEAARWLQEHDPPASARPPKAAGKSKALHRWRQRRLGGG